MLTFIGFLLTILGSINWLLIGLLQYDFIAGLFGFQASLFSRFIYILFGTGSIILIIRMIANKGSLKIWERRKKNTDNFQKQSTNVANSHELPNQVNYKNPNQPIYIFKEPMPQIFERKNAYNDDNFDEHFKK